MNRPPARAATRSVLDKMAELANVHDLLPQYPARLQTWLRKDPRRYQQLHTQRATRNDYYTSLPCLPQRRFTPRILQALAPHRMVLDAEVLAAARTVRPEDENALRIVRRPQVVLKVSRKLAAWLNEPEHWLAFRELEHLWQGLIRAQIDLVCAGVPVRRLPNLHASTAARLRVLAAQHRESLRRYRALLWAGQRVQVRRRTTRVGELAPYRCSDRTHLQLTGDTACEVRFSAARRELRVLRGEVYCQLTTDLAWPWQIRIGALTLQMSSGEFSVGYLTPERIYLQGVCGELQVCVGNQPLQAISAQLTQPRTDGFRLTYDQRGLRFFAADKDPRRFLKLEQGYIAFAATPLEEAAHLLNRHNAQVRLDIAPELAQVLTSEHALLKDPVTALSSVVNSYQARLERTRAGAQEVVRVLRATR